MDAAGSSISSLAQPRTGALRNQNSIKLCRKDIENEVPSPFTLAASVAVAALCLTVPAQAASAATTTNASEATFNEFVATLDVSAETKEGLKEYFAELPDAQQDAYIANPESLFTLDDGGTTVTEETAPATQARSTNAVAAAGAVRTLRVNNKQTRKSRASHRLVVQPRLRLRGRLHPVVS